jgi:glycerophosphoryl diester phosphodiesterase
MPLKKSELYSSIWASCDALRGGMDASQYKDYVLVLLFVKYVSDKYAGQRNPLIVVPPGGSFTDMVALKGDKEIGDKINKIIAKLAEANDLKGVIDVADFNDDDKLGRGKEMVDRLSNLVAIFENPALDFTRNRAEGDDLLGDAYEYLMRHFATESGKSKGQFYTPAEVSRIMAKVIGINASASTETTIYDPTCGSGSLLLKAADEAGVKVTIYGQEMDNATAALARMNMILHDNPTAEIWKDNSLSSPHWKEKDGRLKAFDFVVANPPFSNKAWTTGFDPEHDATLERTTNVAEIFPGREKDPAERFAWAELSQLDAGKWFQGRAFFPDEPIPTLAEVLRIVGENHLRFICDLRIPAADHPFAAQTLDLYLAEIQAAGVASQTWVLAGPEEVPVVRAALPGAILARGLDYGNAPAPQELAAAGYQLVNSEFGLSNRMIRAYGEAGLWVNIWTVDEAWQYSRLWLAGADSVTSNTIQDFIALSRPVMALPYSIYLVVWGLIGIGAAVSCAWRPQKAG